MIRGEQTSVDWLLRRRGYEPGRPEDPADWAGDQGTAEHMRCEVCGWFRLYARGYLNGNALSYRVIAVCPRCGWSVEF